MSYEDSALPNHPSRTAVPSAFVSCINCAVSAVPEPHFLSVFGGFVAGGGEALFVFGGGVGGRPLRNYRNLGIFGDLAFAHSDEAEAWLTLIGAGAVQNFQLEGENIVPYAGAGLTIAVAKTGFGSFEDAAFHISGGIDFPVTQARLFRVDVRFIFFNETVTRVLGSFVF